jgi:hypothetical protein
MDTPTEIWIPDGEHSVTPPMVTEMPTPIPVPPPLPAHGCPQGADGGHWLRAGSKERALAGGAATITASAAATGIAMPARTVTTGRALVTDRAVLGVPGAVARLTARRSAG